MKKEKNNIDERLYGFISLIMFVALWFLCSKVAGAVFASPYKVFMALVRDFQGKQMIVVHTMASLYRSLSGFAIAFICALPVSFLMGWYKPFRGIVEPWIKFVKSIPPIAYIPLIIVAQGVGESAKITVIFIACFLTMVISIYQGVVNVDATLIKAARVLGVNNFDIFFKVVIPASTPYIFVGMRLGMSASLATLIAAELTGAQVGLGQMIQAASFYIQMDVVLLGILIIGLVGFGLDRLIWLVERRLTSWQETITV